MQDQCYIIYKVSDLWHHAEFIIMIEYSLLLLQIFELGKYQYKKILTSIDQVNIVSTEKSDIARC